MERTLCIQVLGATGSGKTKLLALITTLLRKEGVLIVGLPADTVCAEHQQVKFDVESYEARTARVLSGFTQMRVCYNDDSAMTIQLRNKTVEMENEVYTVYTNGMPSAVAQYEVGVRNVISIAVS